jgi:hypothetical protein
MLTKSCILQPRIPPPPPLPPPPASSALVVSGTGDVWAASHVSGAVQVWSVASRTRLRDWIVDCQGIAVLCAAGPRAGLDSFVCLYLR